jgi:hypothetical protein
MPVKNINNGNYIKLFNEELLGFIEKRDISVEENKIRRENRNIFQRLFDKYFGEG